MKEVDRRHAYSLITAWSFLRRRRVDPNCDPNAETTGQHRADTVDRPPSRKHAKAPESVAAQRFPARVVSSHAGGHWFESSSLHQKVPDFVRNQELFLFISSNSDAAFWRFSLDPNRDPKAESTGERWIVLSTPLPLFFVLTWPGRSDPPSGRLCACGCRLSDRCFFGMVSVLSLVVNTQAI